MRANCKRDRYDAWDFPSSWLHAGPGWRNVLAIWAVVFNRSLKHRGGRITADVSQLVWPFPWPDDLRRQTWFTIFGDILDVKIRTSYIKAFKSYRLTDRHTYRATDGGLQNYISRHFRGDQRCSQSITYSLRTTSNVFIPFSEQSPLSLAFSEEFQADCY